MAIKADNLTRRAMLGAAVAIPAIAATCGTVASAAVKSAEGAEWYALRQRCDAAEAVYRQHLSQVCEPAAEAYHAELPAEPELVMSWTDQGQPTSTVVSRRYVQGLVELARGDFAQDAFGSELRRLKNLVEAWDADRARVCSKHNLDAITQEQERLCGYFADIEMQLIQMPAPDPAALGWKIEHLWRDDPGAGFNANVTNIIVADAQRLLCSGNA